ncbi:MAG: oligosaccharide flippase family protein [Pseudomonadales bacterium]|nr:oligosaccharide flippase family protein [Pseudomonadales bacterium]
MLTKQIGQIIDKVDIKNMLGVLLGDFLGQGINYAVNIYIAVHFGALIFGMVNTGAAIANYVAVIVAFGIPVILSKNIVQQPNKAAEFIATAIITRLGITILALTALGLFLLFANYSDEEKQIIFLLSFSASLTIFNLDQSFDALRRSIYHSMARLLTFNLVYLLLVLIVVNKVEGAPVVYVVMSLVVASMLFSLTNLILFHKKVLNISFSFNPVLAKELIVEALPILFTSGLNVVYLNFAVSYLRESQGLFAVAEYSAASRIILILIMFDVAVMRILVPKISALIRIPSNQHWFLLSNIALYRALYAVPFTLVLYFHNEWIIELVYQGQYKSAAPLLKVFGFWYMGTILNHFGTYLYTNGYASRFVKWMTFKLVIFLIISITLTNEYGSAGAAYGLVLSEYIAAFALILLLVQAIRRKN